MIKRKTVKSRTMYLNVPEIPYKINEIIGYLSMEFSKNFLLERDDIAQDLYVVYLDMLKKHPKLKKEQPGYFFIKFKWHLLTKWRRKVRTINKEWEYKRRCLGELNCKATTHKDPETQEGPKKKYKKYKKYKF